MYFYLWDYSNWSRLPALQCSLQTWLNDFPSALGVNATSATSVLPSLIISQGHWHAPVEPSPQLPWQLFLHWAGYLSLSQWWCDKCNNYVNSVQPKCFFQLAEKLSARCFQLLSSEVNNPSWIVVLLHASDSIFFSFSLYFTHHFWSKEIDGNRQTIHLDKWIDAILDIQIDQHFHILKI